MVTVCYRPDTEQATVRTAAWRPDARVHPRNARRGVAGGIYRLPRVHTGLPGGGARSIQDSRGDAPAPERLTAGPNVGELRSANFPQVQPSLVVRDILHASLPDYPF